MPSQSRGTAVLSVRKPNSRARALPTGNSLCLGLEIRYMNRPAVRERRAQRRSPARLNQTAHGRGDRTVVGSHLQTFPVQTIKFCVVGSTNRAALLTTASSTGWRSVGAGDHVADPARHKLLLAGLCDLSEGFGQALLELVNSHNCLRRCLTGERSLGFRLHLRGLCTATHPLFLASHTHAIDDKLGERRRVSKQGRRRCRWRLRAPRVLGGIDSDFARMPW